MLKASIDSLEGKQTIGVLLAGIGGIYYILRSRKPELPPVEDILKHVNDVADLAKVYTSIYSSSMAETSNSISGAFDFGAIGGILALMHKMFENFNSGRVGLKKEEIELKKEEIKLKKEEIKLKAEEAKQVLISPVLEAPSNSKPKF